MRKYDPDWKSDWKSRKAYRKSRIARMHYTHRGRRFFIFFFFVIVFGLIPILIGGGLGLLASNPPFPLPHKPQPDRPGFLICGGAAMLAFMAMVLANWARRAVANPLAGVMEVTEKVIEGDLSARVEESRRGPFSTLESTFNRMLDELETTDRQRRNLAADVAHELNTPLHIIQGYLEGILDGIYPPDENTINILLDETQLLSRLVEDLRTLSLAEAGELPLKLETFPLEELLNDVLTSFSGQSEEAGIRLTVSSPGNLQVTADPDRLDQIIGNLMVNALRHTPDGGEIRIFAEQGDGEIVIMVEDNGEGIAPEDLPQIFNRFWRKDKSRERQASGGHGLGLAITQQLVHAHGGHISVESEVGVGTKFTISLPE